MRFSYETAELEIIDGYEFLMWYDQDTSEVVVSCEQLAEDAREYMPMITGPQFELYSQMVALRMIEKAREYSQDLLRKASGREPRQ